MENINRIMIAGTNSGCGKTTITCGILNALVMNGQKVTSFKCGPDYIDPMFHSEIIGTKSRNIDLFLCGEEIAKYLFAKNSRNSELSLVEGVMGFYDGMGGNSYENSSYDISNKLDIPVVLVVGCKGASLSVVAMIKGYLDFYPNKIKAVILNNVSKAMYPTYKEMIEKHLNIKVLGFMPHEPKAALESRHLGLVTAGELESLQEKLDLLAKNAMECIDLQGFLDLAKEAKPFEYREIQVRSFENQEMEARSLENQEMEVKPLVNQEMEAKPLENQEMDARPFENQEMEAKLFENQEIEVKPFENQEIEVGSLENQEMQVKPFAYQGLKEKPIIEVRIAVAKDKAFCFYYEDSLNLLEELGVKLIPFSPLEDEALPAGIHGLILGGGYPELYLEQLSSNTSMKESIQQANQQGLPIYAECGGYMYLGERIIDFPMVGIIPMTCEMTNRLQNFGYVTLNALKDNFLITKEEHIPAHEFHYSVSDNKEHTLSARKASGKTWDSGYSSDHVFALYPHLHFWGNIDLAKRWLRKCEEFRDEHYN